MNRLDLLANILQYIEDHLTDELKTEDIAKACYCSKSTIEKMFRCMNHISVHDYIIRRKMMLAAKLLYSHKDITILDAALRFGYGSNESFTRTFKSVWNCTPSDFRKQTCYTELFPRLLPPIQKGVFYMNKNTNHVNELMQTDNLIQTNSNHSADIDNPKNVDISELYDLFLKRKDCYFVCCDIKEMNNINEISHKCGDLAIIETINRLNRNSGTEDIVFRIGGDEFAIITNSTDENYANSIANSIHSLNENTFTYENQKIPLTLYVSVVKLNHNCIHCNELFHSLHKAICSSKG